MTQRVVLITGANGGAGRAITLAFLDAGDTVAGVARKITAQDFNHANFVPIPADLIAPDGAGKAVAAAAALANRIDVVVHVMGGFEGGQPVWQTDDTAFERMLDVNFRSAVRIIRAAIPHMLGAAKGRVIAIGSRQAVEPAAMVGAYNVSKAALVSLIRTLALELKGTAITANAILPGTIDTPANRAAMPDADPAQWVKPESIASLALWLASDPAAAVNGASIPIYGPA